MPVATHLVKLSGKIPTKWRDKELKEYAEEKLKLVDDFYDTEKEFGEYWVEVIIC